MTIDSFYGADNNTDANLIDVDVDDISITINGTLQGGNDLIIGSDYMDNLAISIAEGGEVVANNTRAFDIDGNSRIQDNVTITNSGTIYAANRNAISAQTIRDSTITNNATGLISAADRTILLINSTRTNMTNYGSIVANEDNISYRNDTLTLTRTTSTPGYAIAATSATDLTLVNEGTISSNGQRTIYTKTSDGLTLTNSGTITGTGDETIQIEEATNAAITISGTISGADNTIYGDELEDSTFTNSQGGTITATGDIALYLQYADNATFTNNGTLTSSGGSVIDTRNAVSAIITNSGTISTTASGSENIMIGNNTVLTNSAGGTLSSASDGLSLAAGNEFKNYGSLSVADDGTAINITGNNNTIRLYDGSSLSGMITAGGSTSGNILSVETDNGMTVSDNITGAIGLTKLGDGTLDITGAHSYTGATTLTSGTLKMNGTAAGSAITIGTQGTLGGAGTTGDIVNNGTLAPGNSIGTLNVTGDVTLNSGSTLEIEITGDGASDKLIISGTATADGTLKLVPTKATKFGATETYNIITAGTATGTFDDVSMRACGADITTNYTATGIEIVVSGCYGKRGDVVDKLEDYINQLYDENPSADLNTVLTALEDLSGTAYEEALGSISANAPSAIAQATSQNMRTVNGFIAQRAAIQAGGNAARQTLRMMTSADPLTADNKLSVQERLAAHSQKGMWVKGYGGFGDKKAV